MGSLTISVVGWLELFVQSNLCGLLIFCLSIANFVDCKRFAVPISLIVLVSGLSPSLKMIVHSDFLPGQHASVYP